jgi:hypothetical protein
VAAEVEADGSGDGDDEAVCVGRGDVGGAGVLLDLDTTLVRTYSPENELM